MEKVRDSESSELQCPFVADLWLGEGRCVVLAGEALLDQHKPVYRCVIEGAVCLYQKKPSDYLNCPLYWRAKECFEEEIRKEEEESSESCEDC